MERRRERLGWPSLQSSFVAASRRARPSMSIGITGESWQRAEQVADKILQRIRPTVASEERRKAIVGYVKKLFTGILGAEVLPFGSVPLKTYLPDGDIDLTAINCQNPERSIPDIISVLHSLQHNKDAEFEVKDTEYINAEVKLVKCLIENIVIDISFNQIGGVTTFCFLEMVDRRIGNDHLFKRSIILIKAWCYYESRILGAHHGLISTYALEMLILHIFNIFHKSLHGPLGALYKFLEYFSKFDWDNYCVTLHGRVALSSLPNLDDSDDDKLLLSKEFLENVFYKLSLSATYSQNKYDYFLRKNMNIIDPLKENNNLGRSINKGNFYRIRSALTYGARKLGEVLEQPQELMAKELSMFFVNTLDTHGNRERPHAQVASLFSPIGSTLDRNSLELPYLKIENDNTINQMTTPSTCSREPSAENVSSTKGEESNILFGPVYKGAGLLGHSKIEIDGAIRENLTRGKHTIGEAQGHASNAIISRTLTEGHKSSSSGSETECSLARKGCGNSGIPQCTTLSNLTGDLELLLPHLQAYNGQHGMYGQALMPTYQRNTAQLPDQQKTFFSHHQAMLLQMNLNAAPPRLFRSPGNYSVNSSSLLAYGTEDRSYSRGTGPYFPAITYNPPMSRYIYKERPSVGNENYWVPVYTTLKDDTGGSTESTDSSYSSDEVIDGQQNRALSFTARSPHFVPASSSRGNGSFSHARGRHEYGSCPSPPVHVRSQEHSRRISTTTNRTVAPDSKRPTQSSQQGNKGKSPA